MDQDMTDPMSSTSTEDTTQTTFTLFNALGFNTRSRAQKRNFYALQKRYIDFVISNKDRPYLMGDTTYEQILAQWAQREKFRIIWPVNYLKSYREFLFIHRGRLPTSHSKNPTEKCLANWAKIIHERFLLGLLAPECIYQIQKELGLKWLYGYESKSCQISWYRAEANKQTEGNRS